MSLFDSDSDDDLFGSSSSSTTKKNTDLFGDEDDLFDVEDRGSTDVTTTKAPPRPARTKNMDVAQEKPPSPTAKEETPSPPRKERTDSWQDLDVPDEREALARKASGSWSGANKKKPTSPKERRPSWQEEVKARKARRRSSGRGISSPGSTTPQKSSPVRTEKKTPSTRRPSNPAANKMPTPKAKMPCKTFVLDMMATEFGACKCGFVKVDHTTRRRASFAPSNDEGDAYAEQEEQKRKENVRRDSLERAKKNKAAKEQATAARQARMANTARRPSNPKQDNSKARAQLQAKHTKQLKQLQQRHAQETTQLKQQQDQELKELDTAPKAKQPTSTCCLLFVFVFKLFSRLFLF